MLLQMAGFRLFLWLTVLYYFLSPNLKFTSLMIFLIHLLLFQIAVSRVWGRQLSHAQFLGAILLLNRPGVGGQNTITEWTPLLPGSPCTRFALPAARELQLSMSEIGEKERNYSFESYADLE